MAVQAVGAAAGSMVASHNVVAASAAVGLREREGATLRKTFWPTQCCVTFADALTLFAIQVLGVSDVLVSQWPDLHTLAGVSRTQEPLPTPGGLI